MKRWLEGPYSLDKQVQQTLIQATQKSGSSMTPANYRKSTADFDYIIDQLILYLKTEFGEIMYISCLYLKMKSIVTHL